MVEKILWCDAEANCSRLSTREGVVDLVRKSDRAGITTIIVDVKPLVGEALYTTALSPRLGEVNGFAYPESFDLLRAMIEEGHRREIPVHAAINIFSEGCRQWGRGPAYSYPEWQVTMYEAVRVLTFDSGPSVRVEWFDTCDLPGDAPAIFTRKSGQSVKSTDGRSYITIADDIVKGVVAASGIDLGIPRNGCILSVVGEAQNISIGSKVEFSVESVLRRADESRVYSWGIFANPIGPVRDHAMDVIREIITNYEIDGIVFDRMRYPNMFADFSEVSRDAFMRWLGISEISWPEDVFRMSRTPWNPVSRGKYYKEWLEWRAWQIRDFARDASALVRSLKPWVQIGTYVGSWYESYYDVGANWGSRNFHPQYEWMTSKYNRTGFAEFFNYICTGCYYPIITREDARKLDRPEGATVEAACDLSMKAVNGAVPVYGSLYLRDYAGKPDDFKRGIDTCIEKTGGVMLFDLVYLEDYGWWNLLKA